MSENITNNPSVPTQIISKITFPKFINNLGIIPTSYKDSMSYYETLAWFCKYLEDTVTPAVNQNADAVQELQGLYNQLQEYVVHYFDNLDVQEEINNKLDEMVKDGTLREILNNLFYEINNQIITLRGEIQSVASGSPAGVYATKSALETANPDHSKIYVVNADGNWYYYNTTDSEWTAGGVYQSTVNTSDVEILNYKMDKLMPTLEGTLQNTRYSGASILTNQESSAKKYTFTAGTYKYILIDSYQVLNINIYTFFDSNNNIISYLKAPTTTNVKIKEIVRVPANATSLIVSVNTGYASYINTYEATKNEIRNNTNSIGDNIQKINNYPITGIVKTDGTFITADGTWKRTDYINITNVYRLKTYSSYNEIVLNIAFFDEEKNFIEGSHSDQSTSLLEIYSSEFPENAVYIVACARNTISYYLDIEYDNLYKSIINLSDRLEEIEKINFKNLKFACFGDSITSTEVTGTGTKINSELGTNLIENFAHGNATCSDWYDGSTTLTVESPNVQYKDDNPNQTALYMNTNVLSNQVRRCLAKATATGQDVTYTHPIEGSYTLDDTIWTGTGSSSNIPDIIYIAISINDGLSQTIVQDDTATVFQQTYAELNKHGIASSLRWAIETLQSKFPDAQIFVCSPLQTGKTPSTDSRLDYTHTKLKRDIIAKVCEFCSVHFIDSFSDSGFSAMLSHGIASQTTDLVHPTQEWSYNIARYIAQNIKNRYTHRTH